MNLACSSYPQHRIAPARCCLPKPRTVVHEQRKRPGFGQKRPIWKPLARAAAAAAGAGGGGSGWGGASGGGGGGDGGEGTDGEGSSGKRWFRWEGWERRAAADPQFGFKVFCELVVGLTAMVVGDMSSRPNWGLAELDLVFATLVVGAVVNFSAVWVLAPTAAAAGAGTAAIRGAASSPPPGLLQRLLGDSLLTAWGAPGSHMFQPGYALGPRLVNLAYKSAVFSVIGMCAGVVGTALSNGLISLRKRLDPAFSAQSTPPTIMGNALCWALHMGVSSNLRYQVINGMDMVLQPAMSSLVFRLYSFLLRIGNNVLGGMTFVMVARVLERVQQRRQALQGQRGRGRAPCASSAHDTKAGWAHAGE